MHDNTTCHCAEICFECEKHCTACAAHCANEVQKGNKEHFDSFRHCQDCADLCGTTARILARGGVLANIAAIACADACNRCAEICEDCPEDEHMRRCAEICRRCEEHCRDMAAQPVH